jgi:hypothetical protein
MSLIQVGQMKNLIDHDFPLYKYDIKKTALTMTVLNTSRTYKRPYLTRLPLIQIGHIQDLIDHDCL